MTGSTELPMSPSHYPMPRYVMFDQTRDKVRQIMHEHPRAGLITSPSWLALTLLIVAFNIIAASSA